MQQRRKKEDRGRQCSQEHDRQAAPYGPQMREMIGTFRRNQNDLDTATAFSMLVYFVLKDDKEWET